MPVSSKYKVLNTRQLSLVKEALSYCRVRVTESEMIEFSFQMSRDGKGPGRFCLAWNVYRRLCC